ncbi:MAG: hypothetical protein HY564_02035 [Candidatus Jacksonbacteria bacterium]|nr:hypothetical protein [Candidatus Jacksonbacteria bacterium]
MSLKTLSIITIIVFLITAGLLGVLFFVSKQPQNDAGIIERGTTLETTQNEDEEEPTEEKPQAREEGVNEFDEKLFDESEAAAPSQNQAERAEVEIFVRAFIEDYASFSSASGYSHIENYYPQMTEAMREFTDGWIKGNPAGLKSDAFYSIETSVANLRIDEFSDPANGMFHNSATVLVETSRVETDVPEYYNRRFKKDVEVKLLKEGEMWKVSGVYFR